MSAEAVPSKGELRRKLRLILKNYSEDGNGERLSGGHQAIGSGQPVWKKSPGCFILFSAIGRGN